MARKLEFVAGVIEQLEALERHIEFTTPQILAEEFLAATLIDIPRPPWWTGQLRNSGAVYIGTRRYMDTQTVAARRGASYLLEENPMRTNQNSWLYGAQADSMGNMFEGESMMPKRFESVKLRGSGDTGSFGKFTTLANKITVVYQSPVAALMHEWTGKFSDAQSGAHYVSSKVFMAMDRAALRLQVTRRGGGRGSDMNFLSDELDM